MNAKADVAFKKVAALYAWTGALRFPGIAPQKHFVTLEDVLAAGKLEPRILEILPALLTKRPSLIKITTPVPTDLARILAEIRKGSPKTAFRGIPPEKYSYWLEYIGQRGKTPAVTKTFRFRKEDLELLKMLQKKYGGTDTEILRNAMRHYFQSQKN